MAFNRLRRLGEISLILAKHGIGELNPETSAILLTGKGRIAHRRYGRRLRAAFADLGPTFIKIGQLMSTRYDLFPIAMIEELEKLQDKVKPLSFHRISMQIERQLKMDMPDVYTDFDMEPIASASIAQVHRAKLITGEDVVIKVRRPGIRSRIEADLSMLLQVAGYTESAIPSTRMISPVGVLKEFETALKSECNFELEAAHAIQFRKNFEKYVGVVIPKIYEEFSTDGLITMEYLDGVKITDSPKAGFSGSEIASLGFKAVLKMIFNDGFFHADPHPANVLVLKDGQIGLLDHGMVGHLNKDMLNKVVQLLMAISTKNGKKATQTLISMGEELSMFKKEVNEEEMTKDFQRLLDENVDLNLEEFDVIKLAMDLFTQARKYHIIVPTEYTLMVKALLTIEGIGRKIDPTFDINGKIQEFFQENMARSLFGMKPSE